MPKLTQNSLVGFYFNLKFAIANFTKETGKVLRVVAREFFLGGTPLQKGKTPLDTCFMVPILMC